MHIVCQSCATTNRIPDVKNHLNAKCGKCGKPIYSGVPVELSDKHFFKYIEKNDLPVIVDFWADWCAPCKQMAPIFESVALDSDGILFAKVDTQSAQQVAAQAGIRSIPTLIFFHKGKEVDRISGALREPQLKQWIMQMIEACSR